MTYRASVLRLILLLLVGLVLPACTTHQQGDVRIADPNAVRAIKIHTSTKSDVRTLLGNPKTTTMKADGVDAWTYKLITGGVTPETYIPVVGLFAGGSEAEAKTVTITFDKNGVVQAVADQRTVARSRLFGGVQTTTTPPDAGAP